MPPGVKSNWDDCDVWTQAQLISYNQGREVEEAEQCQPIIVPGV